MRLAQPNAAQVQQLMHWSFYTIKWSLRKICYWMLGLLWYVVMNMQVGNILLHIYIYIILKLVEWNNWINFDDDLTSINTRHTPSPTNNTIECWSLHNAIISLKMTKQITCFLSGAVSFTFVLVLKCSERHLLFN